MIAQTSASRTKKELEAISQKIDDTKLKFKDLLFPIIIIIVLLGIIMLVLVPMINNAIEFRTELKDVENKKKQLEELKVNLQKMDKEQLESDLIDTKSVIPKTLKVSSFIFYIDELAKEKNLTSEAISANDIKIASDPNIQTSSEYKGVNGPLSYSGSLQDVLSFLESFYSSSPYIVSPRNINLEQKSEGEWEVSLSLTGFYIDDTATTKVDIYRPFKAYTSFPTEMEMLKAKAEKLRETN